MICSSCKDEIVLKIFPDYSSSGIWCAHCGVNHGDPSISLPLLPKGLVDLIDGWNLLWEMAMEDKSLNMDYFEKRFKSMGNELARQVSKYYSCYYPEDNPPVFY
jgi:hypothetical protein